MSADLDMDDWESMFPCGYQSAKYTSWTKITCWDWPLCGSFEMKHEPSAHKMRHQFSSISQAYISDHKQTKMSHYKLSGKSETESSLHQADCLRVRYWTAPATVFWEGQDAFIPQNLHPWTGPRGSSQLHSSTHGRDQAGCYFTPLQLLLLPVCEEEINILAFPLEFSICKQRTYCAMWCWWLAAISPN